MFHLFTLLYLKCSVCFKQFVRMKSEEERFFIRPDSKKGFPTYAMDIFSNPVYNALRECRSIYGSKRDKDYSRGCG